METRVGLRRMGIFCVECKAFRRRRSCFCQLSFFRTLLLVLAVAVIVTLHRTSFLLSLRDASFLVRGVALAAYLFAS